MESIRCREVVPLSEGPLLEVILYYILVIITRLFLPVLFPDNNTLDLVELMGVYRCEYNTQTMYMYMYNTWIRSFRFKSLWLENDYKCHQSIAIGVHYLYTKFKINNS